MSVETSQQPQQAFGLEDTQTARWLDHVRASNIFRDSTTRGLQRDAGEAVDAYFNLERHGVFDHHQLPGQYSNSSERTAATIAVLGDLYTCAASLARFVQETAHGCNDPELLLRYAEIPVTTKSLRWEAGSVLDHDPETKSPSITVDPKPNQSELWQEVVLGEEGLKQVVRRSNLAHMMGLILLRLSSEAKLQIHTPGIFATPERSMGERIFARDFASEFLAGPAKRGSIKSQLEYLLSQSVDLETIGRVLAYRNDSYVSVGISSPGRNKPPILSKHFGPFLFSERSLEDEPEVEIPSDAQGFVTVIGPNKGTKTYRLPRADEQATS